MGVGNRIQLLRIKNGLTQEQLAEKLSVSRQSVSKWEMEQSHFMKNCCPCRYLPATVATNLQNFILTISVWR